MVPNKNNFCGGAFDDWREVMLHGACDGRCSWCIERKGFRPEHRAPVSRMVELLNADDASNIILLGGEPTLCPDLRVLVAELKNKNVYLTTNGTNFNADFIASVLPSLSGLNVSIHHYDLLRNRDITGIDLNQGILEDAVAECRRRGISIRFNCNIIRGEIGTLAEAKKYVRWAKETGVDRVRFAELKASRDQFVSLAKIFRGAFGLNENPYIEGCGRDGVIEGMPINFRQMCGLQTPMRSAPTNPHTINEKLVLYYDGKYYTGWQSQRR